MRLRHLCYCLVFFSLLIGGVPHASYSQAFADPSLGGSLGLGGGGLGGSIGGSLGLGGGDKPTPSPAAGELQSVDQDGNRIKCSDMDEAKGGKVIGKIVPCMARSIQDATIHFTSKMVEWLRPLLYTFLTLVIVMFGIRMLGGEQEIHKHGLVLIIKIAFLVGILDMMPTTLVPATYGIMKQSQEIVLGALDSNSIGCTLSDWGDSNTMPIWALSDCVVGKLFGYAVDGGNSGQPGMLLQASFMGLLSGFLFGGAWGVVVFFGMLGVLLSIFTLMIRVIYSFISGYLIICLMFILSPLFLPLMLMKSTQNYSEAIWKNIISGFIMPVIVTAYAMIAFTLYDRMLFAPDSMLTTLFNYAKVSPAQLQATHPCSFMITNDIMKRFNGKEPDSTQLNNFMKDPFLQNPSNPSLAGNANDLCGLISKPELLINNIDDPAFQKGTETYNTIFYQLMTLMILAYLIQKGLSSLNTIISQLSLSSGTVGTLSQMASTPGEILQQKVSRGRDAAITSFKNAEEREKSDSTGARFVARAPTAMGQGLQEIFGKIQKND